MRREWTEHQRTALISTVRHRPLKVTRPYRISNTYNRGVESIFYRFRFSNGLSAVGVWLRLTATHENAPATVFLHDRGRTAASAEVKERLFRGEQVLAIDLLLSQADSVPRRPGHLSAVRMLSTLGDRALGLQAAQLQGIAHWLRDVQKFKKRRACGSKPAANARRPWR